MCGKNCLHIFTKWREEKENKCDKTYIYDKSAIYVNQEEFLVPKQPNYRKVVAEWGFQFKIYRGA